MTVSLACSDHERRFACPLILRREPRGTRASLEGRGDRHSFFSDQMATTRKRRQSFIVKRDQRLLFAPRPSFDLLFAGNGVDDAVICFGKDKHHGAPLERICLLVRRIVVFPDTCLDRLLGDAGVVAAVRTAKNVYRGFKRSLSPRPSRLMTSSFAPQDEGKPSQPSTPVSRTDISATTENLKAGHFIAPHPEVPSRELAEGHASKNAGMNRRTKGG